MRLVLKIWHGARIGWQPQKQLKQPAAFWRYLQKYYPYIVEDKEQAAKIKSLMQTGGTLTIKNYTQIVVYKP